MPPKKSSPNEMMNAIELRKLIRAHNKLSKITIPKGTNLEGLVKLINDSGYTIDHKNKMIKPKPTRGKQIALEKSKRKGVASSEELLMKKVMSPEEKKKIMDKKKVKADKAKAEKDSLVKQSKKEGVKEFKAGKKAGTKMLKDKSQSISIEKKMKSKKEDEVRQGDSTSRPRAPASAFQVIDKPKTDKGNNIKEDSKQAQEGENRIDIYGTQGDKKRLIVKQDKTFDTIKNILDKDGYIMTKKQEDLFNGNIVDYVEFMKKPARINIKPAKGKTDMMIISIEGHSFGQGVASIRIKKKESAGTQTSAPASSIDFNKIQKILKSSKYEFRKMKKVDNGKRLSIGSYEQDVNKLITDTDKLFKNNPLVYNNVIFTTDPYSPNPKTGEQDGVYRKVKKIFMGKVVNKEVKKPAVKKEVKKEVKKPAVKKDEPTNTKKAQDLYETIKDRKWNSTARSKLKSHWTYDAVKYRVVDATIKGNKFTIFYYHTDDWIGFHYGYDKSDYTEQDKKDIDRDMKKRNKAVFTIPQK
tara:strand:+ start:1259 stop:2833 length:1575 start_codon:yes stop_codon:yes gene_type:complete